MEEDSCESPNVSSTQQPVFRRGGSIAVRSSKPLTFKTHDIIAEANEDSDSLKTDVDDDDSNKDED